MAKLFNLARMTTATVGTGTIALGAAVSGYLTFAQAGIADGDTVSYGVNDGANSEVGTGVYTAAGTTLTRSVTKSTNSNTPISLSGTAQVLITSRAEDFLSFDAAMPQLTLSHVAQAQANLNLASIHRRPLNPWLPKWGIARANVLANVSNAKLLCIGDSTFAGTGAQPSNANVAPFTFPAKLAQALTAKGLNASWQSRWSDNNFIASGPGLATADSRVTMGGWVSGGFATLGGALISVNNVGAKFSFTPTVPVDSFDFYYHTNINQGTLTLDINGGSATSISENAALAMHVATKTGTLGANTLNVTQTAPSNVYFTGIVAYNSAIKEVSVINAGTGSATAATFADSSFAFSAIGVIGFLAPDLTIIDLTINDAAPPTTLATYQANLQAVITAAKVSGDVILLGGVPVTTTYATLANQVTVNNMAAAVAAKNGVNYISMLDLWGSQAAISAAGWSADGIHPNGAGYAAQAALIAPYLM